MPGNTSYYRTLAQFPNPGLRNMIQFSGENAGFFDFRNFGKESFRKKL